MAQRSSLVYTDNPGSVPATYRIPDTLDLVLQSVVARFNGAAAASSFIPCLSVYSSDGRLIGRFSPSQALAVGDTGVVTFAPFLGVPQASLDLTVTACYVRRDETTPQSIVSSSAFDTTITFTIEEFDNGGMFDAGSPTRITIQRPGIYLFAATAGINANAGDCACALFRNGTENLIATQQRSPAGYTWGGNVVVVTEFAAGDYVQLKVAQSSGASVNSGDCWLSAQGLGQA